MYVLILLYILKITIFIINIYIYFYFINCGKLLIIILNFILCFGGNTKLILTQNLFFLLQFIIYIYFLYINIQ